MIRTAHAHMPVFATTHAGMSGKNNEDRYAVSAFQLGEDDPTPVVFAVLADGIGGHRAGEVAAEMVVEVISQQVAISDARNPQETLTAAIHLASQQVYATAQADESRVGMGSTCSCAWVINDRLYTATVGDSRIYLLRGAEIFQLSTDHTWIQEALERGILTPEQARNHPNQHVIRRYLGSPTSPEVDFRVRLEGETHARPHGVQLEAGDRLLLCSDGLTDLVNDDEMCAILDSNEPDAALNKLVELANARGGHDNITLVLLQAPAAFQIEMRKPARKLPALLVAGVLLLLALVALGVWGISSAINDFTRVSTLTPTPALVTVTAQPGTNQATLTRFVTSTLVPLAATSTIAPVTSAAPLPTLSPTATMGLTQVVLPTLPGATLTPWPTNTPRP